MNEAALLGLIEELEYRVRELERLLGQNLGVPDDISLSPTERRILGALLTLKGDVTRDAIFDVVFAPRPDVDWPEPKCIDVYLTKIRQKLKAWCERRGIAPVTIMLSGKSSGWRFSADDKRRLIEAGFRLN